MKIQKVNLVRYAKSIPIVVRECLVKDSQFAYHFGPAILIANCTITVVDLI